MGAVVTVVVRALLQPLPAPVVTEAAPGAMRVQALARQATWRDIGAGVGPLIVGFLLPVLPHLLLYSLGSAILAASTLQLLWRRWPREPAPETSRSQENPS